MLLKIFQIKIISKLKMEKENNIQNYIFRYKNKAEFESIDKDLYSTFHGAEIKNISVDNQGNINLRIEDFYNFNPGRTSVKGRIGEKHQNRGELGPYYIITVLKIPKEQWQKQCKKRNKNSIIILISFFVYLYL